MHPLFFLVSFWAIAVSSIKTNRKLLNLIIAFLPFCIMIATRERWLTDDLSYYERWSDFYGMNFHDYFFLIGSSGKFEPGFWLLMQIPSFNTTTVLISTFYILTLIYVIYTFVPKKYYPFIVALVLFNAQLATSISARRMTIAMCLFMIAVVLKCKEKRLFSVVCAVSAVLFHNTAVFMLPFIFFPLNFAEKHLKLVMLAVVSVIVLSLLFPGYFNELFIESAEESALEHYSKYAETSGSISSIGFLMKLIIAMVVGLAVFSYTKNTKTGSYSFMFLMAIIYLTLSVLNIGQARIKVYTSLFAFIFVILSYQKRHKEETKALLILFVALIAVGYILWYRRLGDYGDYFSEYSSFLFKK